MDDRSVGFQVPGVPVVSSEKCTGCGRCQSVCPDDVWTIVDNKARPGTGCFLGCFACGHCVAVCPESCIAVTGRKMEETGIVPLPSKATRATTEALESLFLSRRSIREFKKDPVEREVVDQIIKMASLAPVSVPPIDMGLVVFHGAEKVAEFTGDAIGTYRQLRRMMKPWMISLFKPFMKKSKYESLQQFILPLSDTLIDHYDKGKDRFAYGAPLAILFHHGPYSGMDDLAIVATYAMLAAESLGLGTCLLGTPSALGHNSRFREKHGIPASNTVGLGLIAGWPKVKYERTISRQFASVVWS